MFNANRDEIVALAICMAILYGCIWAGFHVTFGQ